MKIRSSYITVLASFFLAGCFSPPEFSNVPAISFSHLECIEVPSSPDSLILSFSFMDGDGDIGLGTETRFTFPPYHEINVVFDSEDSLVVYDDDRVIPPLFSGPSFNSLSLYSESSELPPYSCKDYFILDPGLKSILEENIGARVRSDTILIEQNEFNRNIYVTIYRKRNGNYTSVNDEFGAASCTDTFNARIPIFDRDNLGRSLSGTISYAMLSQGFQLVFLNDTIKMDFYIYDQALNQSNIATTGDFVLSDITRD